MKVVSTSASANRSDIQTLPASNTLSKPNQSDDSERPRSRGGRPSNAMAGEVEERLLEAARSVFLARGYEGATFEQIAETARAGKATLYARYASKEALFIAVMVRNIDSRLRLLEDVPSSAPLRERLEFAGRVMVEKCLSSEVLSLLRLVVAAAPRFPALAELADENGRVRAMHALARIMAAGHPENIAREPPREAIDAAGHFMNVVFAPMLLRGLLGGDLEILQREATAHIAYAIELATDPSGAIFGMRDHDPTDEAQS